MCIRTQLCCAPFVPRLLLYICKAVFRLCQLLLCENKVFPLHQLKSQGSFMVLFAINRASLSPMSLSISSNLDFIQASSLLPLLTLALATCKGQRRKNPASGILFLSSASFPAESTSPNMKGAEAQIQETMSSIMNLKRVSRSPAKPRLLSFVDRSIASG